MKGIVTGFIDGNDSVVEIYCPYDQALDTTSIEKLSEIQIFRDAGFKAADLHREASDSTWPFDG